jgi:hypothetical protein
MFSKVRILSPKNSTNNSINNIKKLCQNKSISVLVSNIYSLNRRLGKINTNKGQIIKSNSVDNSSKRFIGLKKDKKVPGLFNLSLHKHNSQGSLYINKNHKNIRIDNAYQKINTNIFNDVKTPKLVDFLNYQLKKKKKYLETYGNYLDDRSNKIVDNYENYKIYGSVIHKKKNHSMNNKDFPNFSEWNYNKIFKGSRNIKKGKPKENNNNYDNNNNKYHNKYDKTKCIIERRIYGGNKKATKNNNGKILGNKTFAYNYQKMKFKNLYNESSHDINIEDVSEFNPNNQLQKINLNLDEDTNINSKSKLLLKSKTNNLLNSFFEETNDARGIKIVYPINNKSDSYNESSQESTNPVGNSNKYTINNINNIGYRKEKFISGFLDGPEDIHYHFVELCKQRKNFYENFGNKMKDEEKKSLDINNDNTNDFNSCEYSEYFDNYNEDVPII